MVLLTVKSCSSLSCSISLSIYLSIYIQKKVRNLNFHLIYVFFISFFFFFWLFSFFFFYVRIFCFPGIVLLLNMVESTRCHFISQKAEKRVLHIRSATKQKEKGKKQKEKQVNYIGLTFVRCFLKSSSRHFLKKKKKKRTKRLRYRVITWTLSLLNLKIIRY